MARKKANTAEGSKSDVIREIFAAQPDATVKEVKAALEERGIKASDALINKIKYGRGATPGKRSRGRRGKSAGGHGSKAAAIRETLQELGADARPRDVIAALASRGVTVTSAQVSMLRKSLPKNGAARQATASSVSLEHLIAAKSLADRLGGIEQARQALASLAKLMQE